MPCAGVHEDDDAFCGVCTQRMDSHLEKARWRWDASADANNKTVWLQLVQACSTCRVHDWCASVAHVRHGWDDTVEIHRPSDAPVCALVLLLATRTISPSLSPVLLGGVCVRRIFSATHVHVPVTYVQVQYLVRMTAHRTPSVHYRAAL